MRGRGKEVDLDERVAALQEAIEAAEGRVPAELLAPPRLVLDRTAQRRAHGERAVVVALCGGTGTGKSSLFNRLVGADLARVDVRRPTTDVATAWSVGNPDELQPLLDWLGIEPVRRHLAPPDQGPEGLVLVDLPDMDSVASTNRTTADRLLERVDVLVWVVDPQKYAQRSLHEGYLARLREHAEVTVMVLNHADRLDRDEQRMVAADLERLLGDGRAPPVLVTSAATGDGVEPLRDLVVREVSERRAVARRISADLRTTAEDLLRELDPPSGHGTGGSDADRAGSTASGEDLLDTLTDELVRLGGIEAFASRAEERYLRAARHRTRTPLLQLGGLVVGLLGALLSGVGVLGRLALVRGRPTSGIGAQPVVGRLDVRHALLRLVAQAREHLPWFWAERVADAAEQAGGSLPAAVQTALAGVPTDPSPRRWWSILRAVWIAAELTLVVGVVWLVVLPLVTLWLQLPPVPPVTVGDGISLPGALVAAGAVLWAIVAVIRRLAIPRGARRHRRAVEHEAREAVRETVRHSAVAPLRRELDAFGRARERLALAAS